MRRAIDVAKLDKITIRGFKSIEKLEDKVAWGVTAVADISVPVLRAGCPWLDRWLSRISGLAQS